MSNTVRRAPWILGGAVIAAVFLVVAVALVKYSFYSAGRLSGLSPRDAARLAKLEAFFTNNNTSQADRLALRNYFQRLLDREGKELFPNNYLLSSELNGRTRIGDAIEAVFSGIKRVDVGSYPLSLPPDQYQEAMRMIGEQMIIDGLQHENLFSRSKKYAFTVADFGCPYDHQLSITGTYRVDNQTVNQTVVFTVTRAQFDDPETKIDPTTLRHTNSAGQVVEYVSPVPIRNYQRHIKVNCLAHVFAQAWSDPVFDY